ncbi:MAG: Ig-like domain repeat protein, partial [Methanosphaera sp.]|nr:Ig-like domain repeat protein [Methanosphaera sp.]
MIIIIILIIGISVVNAQKVSNDTLTKKSSINIQKTTPKEIFSTKILTQKKNKVSTNNITNKQIRKNITQKSLKTEQKTHIINNNNFKNYFDSAGNINSSVSKGDILDFQGVINQSQSMKISVPVNITSSTNDAKICLNTTATSYFGNESGNSFTINNDAAYTNISKIIFYNTQFFIINTSYVTINNITTNVTDPYVGLGVGQCAIREFCEHILVENSTFCTTHASWVATLVFTGVKDSIIRNNTIRGSGDVFNLLYLNTYNFPGVEVTDMTVNVNNTIENNYIDGTRAIASAKCYAIGIFGSNNTIRNNTINYSGVGITTGWVGSGESLSAGTKIINNSFIGGCNIVTPNNGEIINNTADTLSITTKNSIIENNTFNNIYVQTSDFILENYNISGNVLLSENIKNITIKNSSFNSIDLRGNSGNNLEDIKLIQNNISTITIGKDRTGYVNNIEINENNITNAIFINGRRNSDILIINNEIVTDADYSINISYDVENLIIEDNYLCSSKGKGVNAIGATNTIYSQCNIGKNLPDEDRIVILHNTTIKITTTEFDLDREAVIIASVITDIGMVNDGTVTFKDSMGNILKTVYVYKGEAKLKINKVSTTTKVNSVTTKINDTVTITATVTNSLNTTTEGNVLFKDASGKVLSTVKLVNGVATYKTTFKTAGTQKISAVYSETDYYKSSSATSTITVNKLNTKVSIDSVNGKVNDYVTVSVKVFDANSKAVSEGEVSLKLNGVLLKDSKGNVVNCAVKNGVARGKDLADP